MTGQTTVEHKGIAAVLKDSVVRVPTHQRPYSWQTEQVEELLDDLRRAQLASEHHFLGTLVLHGKEDSQELAVLDGQQRLAVTAIILACIADRLAPHHAERAAQIRSDYLWSTDIETGQLTPHLSLSADDEPFFRHMLQNENPPTQSDSNKRLQQTRTLVEHWLAKHEDNHDAPRWLAKLAMYLRNSARVIVLTVPDEANAFLIFETLNDRGLDLSIADLLKNYLLGLAGKDDLPIALNHWTAASAALKAYGGENLFSVFLRHYWSSRYSVVRDKDLYRDIKSRVSNRSHALDLANELHRHSSLYAAIISPEHEYWTSAASSTRANIATLKLLGLEQYRPLLLAALAHFTEKSIDALLQLLVSWNVRLLIVGGLGGGTMERHYSELARGIRAGDYQSTRDIAKQATKFVPNDTLFQASFAEARVSNVNLARYYLRELELNLRRTAGVPDETQPATTLTLEHIFPDNPASPWLSFPDDEAKAFRARIGNLTLLTKRSNSTLKNGPFSMKKKAYADSTLLITRQIDSDYEDWSPQTIEARQNSFAALAPRMWPATIRPKQPS